MYSAWLGRFAIRACNIDRIGRYEQLNSLPDWFERILCSRTSFRGDRQGGGVEARRHRQWDEAPESVSGSPARYLAPSDATRQRLRNSQVLLSTTTTTTIFELFAPLTRAGMPLVTKFVESTHARARIRRIGSIISAQ